MSLANIPDYLTLYKSDADVVDNKYTWNLPSNYFTNCRGNKCYVSLIDCLVNVAVDNDAGTEAFIIRYDGGLNSNTSNKQSNVISISKLQSQDNNLNYIYSSPSNETVKLLIPARPPSITLSTFLSNNTASAITNGVFILKFDYLEETDQYTNTFYNKLN